MEIGEVFTRNSQEISKTIPRKFKTITLLLSTKCLENFILGGKFGMSNVYLLVVGISKI